MTDENSIFPSDARVKAALSKMVSCETDFAGRDNLPSIEGYVPVKIGMQFESNSEDCDYAEEYINPFMFAAYNYGIDIHHNAYEEQNIVPQQGYFIAYVTSDRVHRLQEFVFNQIAINKGAHPEGPIVSGMN